MLYALKMLEMLIHKNKDRRKVIAIILARSILYNTTSDYLLLCTHCRSIHLTFHHTIGSIAYNRKCFKHVNCISFPTTTSICVVQIIRRTIGIAIDVLSSVFRADNHYV